MIALVALIIPVAFIACNNDDDEVTTSIAIDKTTTAQMNVDETVTATITIVASEVKSFHYYKVVDEVQSDPVDILSSLTKEGNTYTYNFSYIIQENDDLHTLGFEFEVVDKNDETFSTALVVLTNLSTRSMFIKYDWRITAETWLGADVLTDADSMIVFRFNEDGTYEEDLSPEYAAATHHFCYWVLKETPNNGDTLAILRLIRRLQSGDTAADEYYDYRITAADESEMTMYWDLEVWGLLDIQRTFVSKPRGDFQPYGTAEMEATVEELSTLDCSNIDENLLTIE